MNTQEYESDLFQLRSELTSVHADLDDVQKQRLALVAATREERDAFEAATNESELISLSIALSNKVERAEAMLSESKRLHLAQTEAAARNKRSMLLAYMQDNRPVFEADALEAIARLIYCASVTNGIAVGAIQPDSLVNNAIAKNNQNFKNLIQKVITQIGVNLHETK